ncbi:HetZ-related protein [Lyngbya aestuarii]|uniref:HetZ-related protein n=1 Tax=Lyngbya aestuarii TaxID=118322 RepID=UPI00403DF523
MKTLTTATSLHQDSKQQQQSPDILEKTDSCMLQEVLLEEMRSQVESLPSRARDVINRIVEEIERICLKSHRIQTSGEIGSWQLTLGRHRLQKYLEYYRLGSLQGRVELHSRLSVVVYRHVAPAQSHLKFAARRNLIEDFMQEFYAESLKAFRRENEVNADYTPRTKIELAEYMAFTELYAKRRINLPNRSNQQLIVLRAQGFAKRQPSETSVDIEQAVEFHKGDQGSESSYSPAMQQVRTRLVSQATDPHDAVLRDRVVQELLQYLEEQGRSDCVNYLVLKLQDKAAADIDEIMGLTAKERDYLQQRFKYHLEKFSRSSHWKLVHQWLGADIDQKLGMSSEQWEMFVGQLEGQQRQLLELKRDRQSDAEIAKALKITAKKVQKRWTQILALAWKTRNSEVGSTEGEDELEYSELGRQGDLCIAA